jgi:ribosomal protein S18 acetylase RimI-like enzyme
MNIREATLNDLQGICVLSNEINEFHNLHMPYMFKKPVSLDQDIPYWSQYIEKEKGIVFIAQKGLDIIGAICAEIMMTTPVSFMFDRSLCHIGTIVVSEKHQKTGVGKALISKVEEWAIAQGAEEIGLNVMHFNTNATQFYDRLGFEVISSRMAKKI